MFHLLNSDYLTLGVKDEGRFGLETTAATQSLMGVPLTGLSW